MNELAPIALQLWTIRHDLAREPERTLERVKTMGIDAVEIAPLPAELSASRLAKSLGSLQLKVAAIHCDLPRGDRINAVVDLARELNCREVIWHGWPRDPAFDTVDGLSVLAEQYNEAYDNAFRSGLHFGLHTHWWEFEPIRGLFPYQVLLKKLNRDIFLEIDTYWARVAGLNPASLLDELKDRVQLLHLKDGSALKDEPMRALGDGVMDFHSILKAASPQLKWLVVELDECESDVWEAVRRSFDYLRALNAPGLHEAP